MPNVVSNEHDDASVVAKVEGGRGRRRDRLHLRRRQQLGDVRAVDDPRKPNVIATYPIAVGDRSAGRRPRATTFVDYVTGSAGRGDARAVRLRAAARGLARCGAAFPWRSSSSASIGAAFVALPVLGARAPGAVGTDRRDPRRTGRSRRRCGSRSRSRSLATACARSCSACRSRGSSRAGRSGAGRPARAGRSCRSCCRPWSAGSALLQALGRRGIVGGWLYRVRSASSSRSRPPARSSPRRSCRCRSSSWRPRRVPEPRPAVRARGGGPRREPWLYAAPRGPARWSHRSSWRAPCSRGRARSASSARRSRSPATSRGARRPCRWPCSRRCRPTRRARSRCRSCLVISSIVRARRAPRAHHREPALMPLDVDVEVTRGDGTIAVSFSRSPTVRRSRSSDPTAPARPPPCEAIAGTRRRTTGRSCSTAGPSTELPPERRGIGVTFQDAMLFPKLSVLENVAFPLRAAGVRPPAPHAREPVPRSPTWRPPSIRRRGPRRSAAGNASASPSRAHSPPNPVCCFSTSRSHRWTPRPSPNSGRCSDGRSRRSAAHACSSRTTRSKRRRSPTGSCSSRTAVSRRPGRRARSAAGP